MDQPLAPPGASVGVLAENGVDGESSGIVMAASIGRVSEENGPWWSVLLLGGAANVGKTTTARDLAARCGASVLPVDAIWHALKAATDPASYPELHYFDPPDSEWRRLGAEYWCERHIRSADAISSAMDAIIEYYVSERWPAIVEGAWITPADAARWSRQYEACERCSSTSPKTLGLTFFRGGTEVLSIAAKRSGLRQLGARTGSGQWARRSQRLSPRFAGRASPCSSAVHSSTSTEQRNLHSWRETGNSRRRIGGGHRVMRDHLRVSMSLSTIRHASTTRIDKTKSLHPTRQTRKTQYSWAIEPTGVLSSQVGLIDNHVSNKSLPERRARRSRASRGSSKPPCGSALVSGANDAGTGKPMRGED